jgi:hypothetical protein
MKHYLLSIYQPDAGRAGEPIRDHARTGALNDEMRAAGTWVFAAGLHAPGTATVLHARGADVLITDGPYVEGKEHRRHNSHRKRGRTKFSAPAAGRVRRWRAEPVTARSALRPGGRR